MSVLEVWGPGLAALLMGLGVGAFTVLRLIRRGSAGEDLDMQLNDIDEQLEHMVAQLRDLEQQRSRTEEEHYAEQTALYEERAASLLRDRDQLVGRLEQLDASGARETIEAMPVRQPKSQSEAKVSPAVGFFASRPQLRGALWGAGIVAVVGGLFLAVSSEQTARAPGASITGNTQPGQGGAEGARPTPSDPELASLMQRLEQNPNDLDALNAMTKRLLLGQMFDQAAQINAKVIALDPENVQGRTYAAVLKGARGERQAAVDELDALIVAFPKHADGHFFRGMLAMQSGDRPAALTYWARFVELAPPSPRRDRIAQMLKAMPPSANP